MTPQPDFSQKEVSMSFVPVKRLPRLALCLAAGLLAAGCNMADRLANVGEAPKLSKIDNPNEQKDYKPVSLPMPKPEPLVRQANSLWRPGARQFFKDQRAAKVGEIGRASWRGKV